ncbi:hypothetical protein H4R35_002049 [Dimargaris xerosporica]|nr:hypothetical protein H4R35_002049 [Dimargaris xerosporica]
MALYDSALTVHVGMPFPNTQTYIVDEQLQLMSTGAQGQIKLHGFRIELEEVAYALTKYKDVHQACVVMQDNQLIGYLSPEDIDVQAIIAFTKTQLPHYMVPAAIVPLDALSLTPADISRSNTIAQLATLMETKEAYSSTVELYPNFRIPEQASDHPYAGIIEPTLALDGVFQFVDAASEVDLHTITTKACTRIDYHQGPICQFRVINLNQRQFLFFVAHHLATDLVTLSIVAGDLELLLSGLPLPAKIMSYQAWSNQLHAIAAALDANTIVLPDFAPVLPLDYPNVPLNRTKEHAQTELVTINGQLLQHFNQFTKQSGSAPVELLMTAFVWAYEQCFHRPKVTVLFESHGRSMPGYNGDVTHTLGWFVGYHYLTLAKECHQTPSNVLAHTRALLYDFPVNGFNLFLAKHLKRFDSPDEQAKSDVWPQVAFSYFIDHSSTHQSDQPLLQQ